MSLAIILDREFRRLEQTGGGTFPTVLSQASFLGMDKTYLSKLRNGATLSRPKASDIASKLRKGAMPGKVAELVEEMLNAAAADAPRATTLFEEVLKKWFAEKASTEAIMIVEFREPPVVAGRPDLAKVVGKAVAEGLFYAMLLPVNMATVPQHPKAIRTYFETLEDYLVETYHGILEIALGEKAEELAKRNETEQTTIKAELSAVQNRLRLYRLNEGGWSSCPALGVRLFYTEEQDKVPGNALHAQQTVGQLWKWVSSRDDGDGKKSASEGQRTVSHEIKLKEAGPELMRATTTRFCPILDYWREKDSLPLEQIDLENFVADYVVDPESYGATQDKPLGKRWKVQPPPELLLNKAIKNYNSRTAI